MLLGFFVFYSIDASKDPTIYMMYAIPRLTLVLLIEVFAYFFLQLYKSAQTEIKYFQNEITNFESRNIALKTALGVNDKTMISEVVTQMASTERNHVLEKGQSTVEIEKGRMDMEGVSEAAKNLAALIKK